MHTLRARHPSRSSFPHLLPHAPPACLPRLQAALAALSGIQDVPEPRSLLTMEEGIQTLQMMSQMGRISRPSHIRWAASQCMQARLGLEVWLVE
jgi:hypothetical protein